MSLQIYVPTTAPEDWKRLLAKEHQWKEGYSAMALAQCWEEHKVTGGPPEIQRILPGLSFFLALPEFKVDLPPKGGRASQTDLFLLGRDQSGLVAVSVEGKVNETFGPTLEERRADPSAGVAVRIAFLLKLLHLAPQISGSIRYQLLHRSAAAILAAQQFGAARAVMLVHSFSQAQPHGQWFDDFVAFGRLFGRNLAPDRLDSLGAFEGVELQIGWVRGDKRFLEAIKRA